MSHFITFYFSQLIHIQSYFLIFSVLISFFISFLNLSLIISFPIFLCLSFFIILIFNLSLSFFLSLSFYFVTFIYFVILFLSNFLIAFFSFYRLFNIPYHFITFSLLLFSFSLSIISLLLCLILIYYQILDYFYLFHNILYRIFFCFCFFSKRRKNKKKHFVLKMHQICHMSYCMSSFLTKKFI